MEVNKTQKKPKFGPKEPKPLDQGMDGLYSPGLL